MRALALVLALTVPLMSGCVEEPVVPGPVIQEGKPILAFGAPVALPGPGSGEPNIAITPAGTLFVTAPAGGAEKPNVDEGSAYLWRSSDGGMTWHVIRQPQLEQASAAPADAATFCSCDADVVASPDGWVYYSDWWISALGLGPGNYLVESSSDEGETWTSNPVPIPQNIVASMDRQWLVAGPDGFVGLFYSFFASASTPIVGLPPSPVPAFGLDRAGQAIEAVFSHDHGETWTDPVPVVPASEEAYQIGHPHLAKDGTLWMPYGAVEADDTFWRDPSHVRVAVSHDLGATWDSHDVADAPEGFDNLWAVQGASDPDTGMSVVVWSSRVDDEDAMVSFAHSLDLEQWSAPTVLEATGIHVLPWAAAGHGKATFGWYGTPARGDPAELAPDAKWFAMAAEWDMALPAQDVEAVRVDPEPVKAGPLCPRGASCAGDRELLDYVSLAYDGQGMVHYAYAASDGDTVTNLVARQVPALGVQLRAA